MRMRNYCWVLLGLILSLPSHAADYYWYPAGFPAQHYSDAVQACAFLHARNGYTPLRLDFTSPTSAVCVAAETDRSGANRTSGNVNRVGDSCPQGEYDPSTGGCVVPDNPCAAKDGQEIKWSKSGTAGDGYGSLTQINGKPMFLPGMNACQSGCAVETTDRRCVSRVNGDYFCRGSGEFTGSECPQGEPTGSDLVPEETIDTPEPQNLKDEQPCIYAADGSKEVCTSSKTDEVEGQICAILEDGSEFCTTKLPEKNGIDIRTEVTKEILADGSVKTTKKDTATVTKCVGVNNCTTTKAETTKTTTEDANGNKTGESSTCKGEACPGKGNPDSDGDGVGDCTGDDCGAGGGGEGQDWYTPTGDTFGSVLTEFVGKVQQTPVASQTSSFLTFRATGSCPRWSVSVWVFDIDIDQLCNGDIPWNAIKAVILAAAGFFAFRIALL